MTNVGFSPGKSTVTTLILSFHNILKSLELNWLWCWIDLRKASDRVPHLPLYRGYGILASIVTYFNGLQIIYIVEDNNYVVVNGVCSPITPVMSGVPQGSILGPLLFITYINPVSNLSLSSEAKLTIYADDILLYKPIFSGDDFSALQQDIDQISNCIRSLHLSMNPSKCKYLITSKKRCALDPPTQLIRTRWEGTRRSIQL